MTTAYNTTHFQPPTYAPPSYHPGSQPAYDESKLQFTDQVPPQYASSAGGRNILFPEKLVYDTAWVSSTSYLGPSKEEPLYAVVTPNRMFGCFNRGGITLNSTTDKESAPIASVKLEKGSKYRRSLITVAPRPGAADEKQEMVIRMHGCSSSRQEFEVPLGAGLPTERFEWRSSRGDEVKELSGGFNFGWKLVRLDGPPIVPGTVDTSNGGYSSDGKEIVAVGIQARLLKRNPEFQFLGTGATGQLGETFEIVAIMGFLRLCELASQEAAAGAAGASSSSSAAAVA